MSLLIQSELVQLSLKQGSLGKWTQVDEVCMETGEEVECSEDPKQKLQTNTYRTRKESTSE